MPGRGSAPGSGQGPVPPDLFDQINFARDIHAERWNDDAPAVRGCGDPEIEARQHACDVTVRHRRAQDCCKSLTTQCDDSRLDLTRVDIRHAPDERTGAKVREQGQCAANSHDGRVDVGAALEARRGFCLQAEAPARGTHRGRQKPRAFEGHAGGCGRHLRRCAAHDTGNRDCAFAVGNHKHRFVECAVNTVECREAFAGARASRVQFGAGQPRDVERMHGLPHFEHDVVGDVDDVVDGANAGRRESVGKPGGRRRDAHIDNRQRVAAAPGVRNRHAHGSRSRSFRSQPQWLERCVERSRGFACQTIDRQRIGTVRRDVEVDHVAVDAINSESARSKAFGDRRRSISKRDEVAHPGNGHLHGASCSRKRRSFS
jgi:hypothetical protein